jgi:hypothetical protein
MFVLIFNFVGPWAIFQRELLITMLKGRGKAVDNFARPWITLRKAVDNFVERPWITFEYI